MDSMVQKLEAVLFAGGSGMTKRQIAKQVGCSDAQLEQLLEQLREQRAESGVVVVDDGRQVVLATHPSLADFMEAVQREEAAAPLSKAMQETLSIIAYAGPIAKVDLDFLRGVNTQYTLRRLLVRGLIQDERKGRTRLVSPATEFLLHMGIQRVEELSDYAQVRQKILDGVQAVKKRAEREEV
ncbi:MAG: SMC-Scp complex subunit ScpB [Candidatus Kaiserbacteria bacterium]|nr:SMC-Scp complex subunit ScpB [Candidatus Kaiserbacteria bacterium]